MKKIEIHAKTLLNFNKIKPRSHVSHYHVILMMTSQHSRHTYNRKVYQAKQARFLRGTLSDLSCAHHQDFLLPRWLLNFPLLKNKDIIYKTSFYCKNLRKVVQYFNYNKSKCISLESV